MFARHGYHETSMSALAAEAGVTKPVLYQHFASKHDLFEELLAETGERLMRAIEASEVEETPRRRVEAGFRAYFRFFEESPAAFALLYGTSLTIDPDFRRDARRVRDTFAEYLTGLIRTVDHESALAARLAWGGLESLA